ncbi:MAG: hypothetical protein LBQ66_10905 [Planctomycetaceae bacterium]|nr:hypothetical protein [Planctomycetaceae bacterium]
MIYWPRNRPTVGCPPYVADAFWRSHCRRVRRRNRPAVGCPPYDHQRKKNLCGITRGNALR